MNRLVEAFHDDLTPRFRQRHIALLQQAFGGTLACRNQLVQSTRFYAERSVRSFVIVEQVIQPFELVNWCCRKDANLNVARQSVNNLSLHVIHVGFIGDLFDA